MPRIKNRRILLVDDERELTDMLALQLSAEGDFTVGVAYDGAQGLREAKAFKPDMILLDLSMPVIDGWEMCRRLREDPATRHIPLVIMTAGTENGLSERAAEQGIAKVLIKPVEDAELLSVLRAP